MPSWVKKNTANWSDLIPPALAIARTIGPTGPAQPSRCLSGTPSWRKEGSRALREGGTCSAFEGTIGHHSAEYRSPGCIESRGVLHFPVGEWRVTLSRDARRKKWSRRTPTPLMLMQCELLLLLRSTNHHFSRDDPSAPLQIQV